MAFGSSGDPLLYLEFGNSLALVKAIKRGAQDAAWKEQSKGDDFGEVVHG